MNPRHLPNVITGLRLAMAPLLPWLMLAGHWRTTLAVALVAAGSDLVDGFLARYIGAARAFIGEGCHELQQ